MKKEAEHLIKSVNKFEKAMNAEIERVTKAIDVVENAVIALNEAKKTWKSLQKKINTLEKKTEKLVQYKGIDITVNYERNEAKEAMDFIDGLSTELLLQNGLNKRKEELELVIVDKKYLDEILKKNKEQMTKEESSITFTNSINETLTLTLGLASKDSYYISNIFYHTLPGSRVSIKTLYSFLEYFSGDESKSRTLETFYKRKKKK
ncbi:MAG: hypothetical protein C0601_07940 [Candidatus Muiribacterium halophilum]|uniref:Uncharacterized protein n=1 Tax=Muiribacterium halophilum TaxID=2053465 RepID=A0A2N5ZF44_MUIH1|nr:MAG: hypothetical protein C0601_07940 [Candidatus Muirbacterium halophilum]